MSLDSLRLSAKRKAPVIQVAFELVEFGALDFLSIPPLHLWRHSAGLDLILSRLAKKQTYPRPREQKSGTLKSDGNSIRISSSPSTSDSRLDC